MQADACPQTGASARLDRIAVQNSKNLFSPLPLKL